MASRRNIDPIARFMQEHNEALVQLSSLNKATTAIAEAGFTREEALFPVLERYVEGPTGLMREDHRVLRKEFRRLRRAVNRLGTHRDDRAAARDLAAVSRVIVQIFVNHIHKENHILFPLVQKFLTKDALREVARRMV